MEAMVALSEDLDKMDSKLSGAIVNADRQVQVGKGERSDRRRVWAFQRDVVEDLVTGRSVRCRDALAGRIDRLW